jgi:hypothetical protein
MATLNQPINSHRPGTFQEKTMPAGAQLVGWAWIVQTFGVRVPVRRPSAVSDQHVKASLREAGEWTIYDKRYWPGDSFGDHLGFALRHENLDMLVLKRIFDAIPQDTVATFVRSAPTGAPNRRAWFLYEFMTGRKLDIEDATGVSFTDLLDSRLYFTAAPVPSRRHKVRNNLLGNRDFCPVIRKTKTLTDFGARSLAAKANDIIGHTGANVVARAASFLLLADSRASFEIEGE